MPEKKLQILLTHGEASALSLAAICGGPEGHRQPDLESARKKLRAALDHAPLSDNQLRAVIALTD